MRNSEGVNGIWYPETSSHVVVAVYWKVSSGADTFRIFKIMQTRRFYNKLIQSLRLVASSYETQVASLPEFVHVPDEIALLYDDSYLLVPQMQAENLIPSHVCALLTELDEAFDEMSEDKSLWTLEKLQMDSRWEARRKSALAILDELEAPYDKPNLDFVSWVS